jgi:hypothetical protein
MRRHNLSVDSVVLIVTLGSFWVATQSDTDYGFREFSGEQHADLF